jgi:hypothetical protein
VQAAQGAAQDSQKQGQALLERADQVAANKANYANMLNDLSSIYTGPGVDREKAINAFINRWTGKGGPTMSAQQIASAESFSKLANMIAAQQLASLGPSDARQSLAMGANPNIDLSNLGNQGIIHMLQGNEDAIAAKARAWNGWLNAGNGPDTYRQFSQQFNQHFDPRVFQAKYMTRAEIVRMRNTMSPAEQAQFKANFDYAQQQGWLDGSAYATPQAPNAAPTQRGY